ncbi:GntR family transcriptional regulator [Vandammella animalimorsus]|uniref:GntR family transcriptional regulator n=1 Tax=Vandammella animalimorsus TaxID=2029117 RepID=UPI001EEF786A|nr:GntR family transcriptional regulator [Vandammella animalimorsus]
MIKICIHMPTLSEQITQQLRDWISQGKLPPGARLEEIPVAQQLGVSRTPVRSALQMLSAEGLIEHRPNRGYTIKEFNLEEIMSAYEARAALEAAACRKAALNGVSTEMAQQLRQCLIVGDGLLAKGRLTPQQELSYQQMNMDLHRLLAQAARSPQVQKYIEHINNAVPQASSRVMRWELDLGILRRSHDDHHRIVAAVLERDAHRAQQLMEEHVYFAGLLFRQSYLQQAAQHAAQQGQKKAPQLRR